MARERELEIVPENGAANGERHRVVIAAAVAALVGRRGHILEIKPAENAPETGWERHGSVLKPIKREALRRRTQIRTKAVRKEEQRETSDHA